MVKPPDDAFVAKVPPGQFRREQIVSDLSQDPDLVECRCVLRGDTLGIFGSWSETLNNRLDGLRSQLELQVPLLRALGWDDVETACKSVADQLGDLPPGIVIVPVPRGGLIVAGLLAYLLDIPRDRVRMPQDGELALVVDDVSISGLRLIETLEELSASRTTVALLAITEAAHDVLGKRFPGVKVVAHESLTDKAEELLGVDYEAWTTRWRSRDAAGAVVLTDHLVFPWSTPDWTLWSDVTQDESQGFDLVSPTGIAPEVPSLRTIEGEFPGTYDDVVWAEFGPTLCVARNRGDETYSINLQGPRRAAFELLRTIPSDLHPADEFTAELQTSELLR